jgi:hypothetical protein
VYILVFTPTIDEKLTNFLQWKSRKSLSNYASTWAEPWCTSLPLCWWSHYWCTLGNYKRYGMSQLYIFCISFELLELVIGALIRTHYSLTLL